MTQERLASLNDDAVDERLIAAAHGDVHNSRTGVDHADVDTGTAVQKEISDVQMATGNRKDQRDAGFQLIVLAVFVVILDIRVRSVFEQDTDDLQVTAVCCDPEWVIRATWIPPRAVVRIHRFRVLFSQTSDDRGVPETARDPQVYLGAVIQEDTGNIQVGISRAGRFAGLRSRWASVCWRIFSRLFSFHGLFLTSGSWGNSPSTK